MTVQELRELLCNVNADAEVFVSDDWDMSTGDEVTDVFIQMIANEVTFKI